MSSLQIMRHLLPYILPSQVICDLRFHRRSDLRSNWTLLSLSSSLSSALRNASSLCLSGTKQRFLVVLPFRSKRNFGVLQMLLLLTTDPMSRLTFLWSARPSCIRHHLSTFIAFLCLRISWLALHHHYPPFQRVYASKLSFSLSGQVSSELILAC